MATYNFTVRATDNAGAFADRTFSMNVNDTTATSTYDRFLVAGSGGISRSLDGINWSVANNTMTGFNRIAYGNGVWVAWNSASGVYRWAPASTLAWSPSYSTLYQLQDPLYTNSGGIYGMDIRFRKGKWTSIFNYNQNTTQLVTIEANTPDITTPTAWAYARTVSLNGYNTSQISCSFDYDPVSDTWIAMGAQSNNNILWRRQGSGPWARIQGLTYTQMSGATTTGTGDLRFTNGLWMFSGYSGDGSFYTSIDGTTFILRNCGTTWGAAPIYQNGRILCAPVTTATSIQTQFRESTNGGRSFVARGAPSFNLPQGFQTDNAASPRQVIATNGATTVMLNPFQTNLVVSTDDFATFSNKTIQSIGTMYCIAARDS